MASLVESTMLYGSEIWGCNRDLEKIEQVQRRALRLFFGMGILHPKVSLLAEMGDLAVKWLARMWCVKFWGKVQNIRWTAVKVDSSRNNEVWQRYLDL